MILLIIWLVTILCSLAIYFRGLYSRFSRFGVKHLRPVPLFGNMAIVTFRRQHVSESLNKAYRAFPEERFIGFYEFLNPIVIIRDLELLKMIAVKDFESFTDHREMVNEEFDPLFGRNLFALKGEEWKSMRSTLSPAFTSSKIKQMVPLMVEVGEQMIKNLVNEIHAAKEGIVEIECKDLTRRYTNDVIASAAFGLKVDSHIDRDNQFYKMGCATVTFSFVTILKLFMFNSFSVFKKLRMTVFSKQIQNFFMTIVLDTMRNREQNTIVRPDMIHLLMEAKKGKLFADEDTSDNLGTGFATVEESKFGRNGNKRAWSDSDLVAQAVLFFLAGFDTISNVMSFLLYELAMNPDIQDRLFQEIQETYNMHHEFDFNTVQRMTYLDMVISETLRKWPPANTTDRVCLRNYNLGKPNASATKDYIVRKGETMFIPIWAIHRNEEYYPNPLKFDPERFSDENKINIKPLTYIPFGVGPRNCIGSRFALCELKVFTCQLLQRIQFVPCEKTSVNPRFFLTSFNPQIDGGTWLRLCIRK